MPSSPSQNSGEQPGLLKILGAVFSGVLFGLFLSKLKTPAQQSIESISPKTKTSDKKDSAYDLSSFSTQIPPSPPTTENPCKCCHHKTPWWKIVLEIGTFVAAVGALVATARYAYIAAEQLVSMNSTYDQIRKQTRTNQESVLRAARPMIGFVGNKLAVQRTPTMLRVSYRLKNSGQIPGRRLVIRYDFVSENTVTKWSYPGLCPQALNDSKDARKPALAIHPGEEIPLASGDLIIPKLENSMLQVCLCYHNWGARGIYTTVLYYSLDRREVVNIEDGTEVYPDFLQ